MRVMPDDHRRSRIDVLEPTVRPAVQHADDPQLRAHPDAQGPGAADNTFMSLNEAYQILQDPKRRLHHLLSLEGHAPSSGDQTVPGELHNLFPEVGALAQRANLVLEKTKATSNTLSRSLLKPQILEVEKETAELRAKIRRLSEASLAQLRELNSDWVKDDAGQIATLSKLYLTFAYLTRWSAQLDEIAFQISL